MSQVTGLANWFLRLPLTWAALATLAFYAGISSGYMNSPFIERYFDNHIVERVATLLFAVGAAALAIRLVGLLGQFGATKLEPLGSKPASAQPVQHADALLQRLRSLPAYLRNTYLVRRLEAALSYVQEVDSADGIEDQLERLHDAAHEEMHGAYATPRLMRATLPIVGMLGTVIGITMAIAQLSPDALEQSLTTVMASLSVAFDTTAQAMSLMLALWFAMFSVERVEQQLLAQVHEQASRALIGRFQQYGSGTDPNVASVRRMSEEVVGAVEKLASRQAETWQSTIDTTQTRWAGAMSDASHLMMETLRQGLTENLQLHSQGLAEGAETQLAKIADAVSSQTAAIDTATSARLQKLTDIEQRHTDRIESASVDHAERLATGADNLLGNLREGLERMAELLVEALQKHGETLTTAESELASENRRHLAEVEAALGESMVVASDRQEKLIRQSETLLKDLQHSLVAAADATVKHQQELVKQGEVLLRVVESTGQVQTLEETLNRNLQTLGRSHNFEETLLSLSAAIQLLSARTSSLTADADTTAPSSHAA